MTAFRQYFEDNPEIFAALVAAIAIFGGLLGSIIGAKIQANGGRDQAAAAREAATIAAEAQRVSALWTVRQMQVAELTKDANALVQLCDRMWFDYNEGLPNQLNIASEALSLRWNELRLIVTDNVVEAAGKLATSAMAVEANAQQYAPVIHARILLQRRTSEDEDLGIEVSETLATSEADSEGIARALRHMIPELTEDQSYDIASYHGTSRDFIVESANRVKQEFHEALIALVHEAREMLRAQDDVAPAVPERRRRWWRPAT